MAFVFKAWEDLTIRDDFMFKAVMMSKDLCIGVLEAILNEPTHDITPQLQAFMDYVNSGIISANPLVQALDKRVNDVKRNENERVSYMKYELNLRDARKDGEAEGEERGKLKAILENVRSLMSSLNCDAHRAMELLKIPVPEQKKILVQLQS